MKQYDLETQPIKGILICILAYLFVSFIGVFKKLLVAPVPLIIILFFQSVTCFTLILPEAIKKGIKPIPKAHAITYTIRILTGLGCYLTLFYLIKYIPISQAFLYQYSASLWIPFIALMWLKKAMPKDLWVGIVIGFIGMIFILQPGHGFISLVSIMGIICGILQAISVIAIRKLSATESTQNILFYYFLVGSLLTGLLSINHWVPLSLYDITKLILIGVCTYCAQKLVAISLSYATAATLASICYISLLFSGLLGWLIWHEIPDQTSLIGMTLVITGCICTLWFTQRRLAQQEIKPELQSAALL